MPQQMHDFQKISKALSSSYEMLEKENMPGMAKKSLRDAEQSFHKAFQYMLSSKGGLRLK